MPNHDAEYFVDYRKRRRENGGEPLGGPSRILSATEVQRRDIANQVRRLRKKEPWPEFGASGCEMVARDAYNQAIYEVIDLIEEM